MRPTRAVERELIQVLRFGIVGLAGFLVDAVVLLFMVRVMHVSPFAGRLVSAPTAIVFTFVCNRLWSFSSSTRGSTVSLFLSYLSTQGIGFVCNLAVYFAVLLLFPNPVAALALSSAAAMTLNYLGARLIVFRD
jgi:putative flippase GtrA